jgi:sentrin-specific protease 1
MNNRNGINICSHAQILSDHWNNDCFSSSENIFLTDQMGAYCGLKYVGSSPEKEIQNKYQIMICKADFSRLGPEIWLNDEIINFYFSMLSNLHSDPTTHLECKFHFLNSHFYAQMANDGVLNLALRRNYKKPTNVFKMQSVFLPVNIANVHWVLIVIDMERRRIKFYDSLFDKQAGEKICKNILKWLQYESEQLIDEHFDKNEWMFSLGGGGIPQQTNGFDCGVFVLMYAEFVSRGLSVTSIDNRKMNIYRKRIALMIKSGELYNL